MNRLSNFNDFALNKSEMKGVRGGDYAYCTNGVNARCYEYFDDAGSACAKEPGCNSIKVVQF